MAVGACPLPFKLRIENTLYGNTAVSQKLPFIGKKLLRSRELFFQAIKKRIFL